MRTIATRTLVRLLVGLIALLAVITAAGAADTPAVRITYVYDNSAAAPGLEPAWGFAVLVEADGKRVLFDTGGDAALLKRNIEALSLDIERLDALVLSHEHWDHTNGIPTLGKRDGLPAYFPASAAPAAPFRASLVAAGMKAVPVTTMTRLSSHIVVSAEMPSAMAPEVGLVIDTDDGLVVLLGCSHPGAAAMLTQIREQTGRPVLMVIGGFHMLNDDAGRIQRTLDEIKTIGVQYVGPTHCSGERAMAAARAVFGDGFVQGGVGTVVQTGPYARTTLR
jgi:7,8-dihydropterin-6-yl-methyl-4-(beta-D-ribofuranosyl)aminobenzene 5'-phosphate synthase